MDVKSTMENKIQLFGEEITKLDADKFPLIVKGLFAETLVKFIELNYKPDYLQMLSYISANHLPDTHSLAIRAIAVTETGMQSYPDTIRTYRPFLSIGLARLHDELAYEHNNYVKLNNNHIEKFGNEHSSVTKLYHFAIKTIDYLIPRIEKIVKDLNNFDGDDSNDDSDLTEKIKRVDTAYS